MGLTPNGYDADKAADEAARLQRVREDYQLAVAHDRRDDEAMHEDNLMLVGGENQWDARAVQERKRTGRPLYTVNKFPSSLAQITGEIRRNRPGITCKPADAAATDEAAEIFEGLIRFIERVSQAHRVYSRVGKSAAACGKGHMRIVPVWEDDEGFDTGLRIRAIKNVHSVKWDPSAQTDDKSDANWCIVVSELDKKSFEEAYPQVGAVAWAKATSHLRKLDGWRSGENDKVTVAEQWVVKREPYERYRLAHTKGGYQGVMMIQPTGEEITIDGDVGGQTIDGEPAEQFLAEYEALGFEIIQSRTAYKRKVCMYLWGGDKQIADPIEWKGARIPIFTVVGEEIDVADETVTHGIIRHAKDAQRGINYTRSAELEVISQSPKASPMVPDDAIEGYEDEWELATKQPTAYRRYKWKPGMPAPQEAQGVSSNPGLQVFGQESAADFEDTTGIHAASLGKKSNETSGVAIDARDAQTDTGTFVYIDNLNSTLESMGNELVVAIPHYYSTREQILILGQDEAPKLIALANTDLKRGKYLVTAQRGPSYQTKREKAADMVVETMKVAPPPVIPVLFDVLVDLTDMPLTDEQRERITQSMVMAGILPPPAGAQPTPVPAGGPGMPGGPPLSPNVIPMPPRGARPAPGGFDPLSPLNAPAVQERAGLRPQPPGM